MRKEYWFGDTYPLGFQGMKYSYANVARNNGYSVSTLRSSLICMANMVKILAVDNLGNGDSQHPDPVDVTQQTLQVAVIHEILVKLRQGTVGGPIGSKKFSKIIYAGHSYGSICGNGIATHFPSDVDAFVLTGYSAQFALGAGPLSAGVLIPAKQVSQRFKALSEGYLAMSLESGREFGLYTNPSSLGGFAAGAPKYDYKYEGTGAIGELATLLYGVGPADSYKGYVFVLTGENDAIVCNVPPAPHCGHGATSLPATASQFFPAAKNYSYHIPPTTGHAANLHLTAPESFKIVTQYLTSVGF